jgi:hypothetical protein
MIAFVISSGFGCTGETLHLPRPKVKVEKIKNNPVCFLDEFSRVHSKGMVREVAKGLGFV